MPRMEYMQLLYNAIYKHLARSHNFQKVYVQIPRGVCQLFQIHVLYNANFDVHCARAIVDELPFVGLGIFHVILIFCSPPVVLYKKTMDNFWCHHCVCMECWWTGGSGLHHVYLARFEIHSWSRQYLPPSSIQGCMLAYVYLGVCFYSALYGIYEVVVKYELYRNNRLE